MSSSWPCSGCETTTLRVSFAGNSGYAPSRAETPFRITTQASALEVQPVEGEARPWCVRNSRRRQGDR
ncbi:MAG: hypothetical protein R2838_17000 [Caldilineaceae bacterium]